MRLLLNRERKQELNCDREVNMPSDVSPHQTTSYDQMPKPVKDEVYFCKLCVMEVY